MKTCAILFSFPSFSNKGAMEFKSKNGQQCLVLSSTVLEVKAEQGRVKTIPLESMVKFMVSKKDACLVRFIGRGEGEDIAFHFEKESDAGLVSKSLNVGTRVKKEPNPTPAVRGLIGSLEALVDPSGGGVEKITEAFATDLFVAMPSLATAYEVSVSSKESETAFWRAVADQYLCFKKTWLTDEAAKADTSGDDGAITLRAASLWVRPTISQVPLGVKRVRDEGVHQSPRQRCHSQSLLITVPPPAPTSVLRPVPVDVSTITCKPSQPRVSTPTPTSIRDEVAAVWDCINRNATADAKRVMAGSTLLQQSPHLPEVQRLASILALIAS